MRAKVFWFFFSKKNCFPSFFGKHIYGLGVIALGIDCLLSRNFVLSQLLPDKYSHETALAYTAAAFMLIAGAAIEWSYTTVWAAASLTIVYALIILIADAPFALVHAAEYGSYSNGAEEFAIAAGAVVVYATNANIGEAPAARLTRIGQCVFGVCAILFGGAHFFYMNLTTPLVPKFLPPSQEFWACATGIFHIAGGIAILANVRARLAAILLTVMYASFTPLIHLPMLVADPHNHFIWTENAVNLALIGAAWVVADSLRARRVVA